MPSSPWSSDAATDVATEVAATLASDPRPSVPDLLATLAERYDQISAPVAYLDRGLRFLYANQAYARVLDRPHTSLLGERLDTLMSPQGELRTRAVVDEVLQRGNRATVEAAFRDPSGQVRHIRTYLPHHGPEGIVGMVVVGDRSERNRTTVDRLTLLHALSTALTLADGPEARADYLLAHCIDYLQAEIGAVALLDPHRGPGLWVYASYGQPPGIPGVGHRIPTGSQPLFDEVLAQRWPQAERDAATGWISEVVLPLEVDDRVLGVILFRLPPGRWLDDGDRAVLLALAEQGAQAFDRARLFDAERRARSRAEAAVGRLRFLSSVSRRLAVSPMDPDAVLDTLASSLSRVRVAFCAVHVLDPSGGWLELRALHHRDPAKTQRYRDALAKPIAVEGTLAGEPVRMRLPLLHPELDAAVWGGEAGLELEALLEESPTGTLLEIPLLLEERALGTLTLVGLPDAPMVDEEEVSLVQKLADRAIIAFEAARAFASERRARHRSEVVRRHLERMHELSGALSGAATAVGVMRVLVDRGLELMQAECAEAYLPEPDTGMLHRVACAEWRGIVETGVPPLPWSTRLPLAEAYRRGQPSIYADRDALLRDYPLMASQPHFTDATQTLAVFPLRTHEGVLGVLGFTFSEQRPYAEEDLVFLRDLARHGALALERAGLYEAQARAVGDRDEFLSIASHELRTPLTPLNLKLELLAREIAERVPTLHQDRLNVHVQVMRRQVRRMGELINGMLDLSRIDSGLLPLEATEFGLPEVVREVVARHQEEASRAGCDVTLELDTPAVGRWDRIRVEQVVTNLLTNALKYGAGHPITLQVGEDPELVWLEISDQGIGIDADQVPRLFQRFARAVSERNYGGLGLGLYITRRIVETHGGAVRVTSVPGQGSTFRVTLPKGFLPKGRAVGHGA